jgi:iron complex transport system substrate-binding protein
MNYRSLIITCIILVWLPLSLHSQTYERIVSLAPSITKSLYYLKAEDKLVGCTSYCEIPDEDKKTVVASAINVNIEKIISLRPDLILVMPLTNPETIAYLKKFSVRVVEISSPKNFSEICDQFIQLGKLVGKDDLAAEIVKETKERVSKIKNTHQMQGNKKIFFQIGANPIFSVLPNTFMNDYITFLGARNIAWDMKGGIISRETVVVRNPDIIFVTSMGMVGQEEKKIWEKFSSMTATKNNAIFIIDADLACLPIPINFVKTLELMVKHIESK